MTIKIVATVDLEYDTDNPDSPLHPLNIAQDHLHAAFSAARRWSSTDRAALEYLAGLLDEQLRAVPRPPLRPSTSKVAIPRSIAKAVFERDAYRCVFCGSWTNLTVDHIYAESKGGTLALDNLQTLCASCNSRKGAR